VLEPAVDLEHAVDLHHATVLKLAIEPEQAIMLDLWLA